MRNGIFRVCFVSLMFSVLGKPPSHSSRGFWGTNCRVRSGDPTWRTRRPPQWLRCLGRRWEAASLVLGALQFLSRGEGGDARESLAWLAGGLAPQGLTREPSEDPVLLVACSLWKTLAFRVFWKSLSESH